MRGGDLHHNVADHTFLGPAVTAPRYRFFSVRDDFPALLSDEELGGAIAGELYEVSLDAIRTDFLPEEPAELQLDVIELDDGRSVLAVTLRPGLTESIADELIEITQVGDWRAYRGLPHPDSATA
ncbi:gamma-glutamylcyclotransferase [Tsukamurella soli]|uniref:Gamma-glutamylcyclotransferase n=2 Tax=Tsukamurella soli TaxID=644556 RepID=A0ABP8K4H5_9ACTN